jgi:esterase/lipase
VIAVGSVSREVACQNFDFLAKRYKGRRKAIKEFTHLSPEFVFWIYPDGTLFDAKDAHKKNVPKGYDYILNDEPDYGGFLRGRLASNFGTQLIVVYCRPEALAEKGDKLSQFLHGISQLPVPVRSDTLVISDNADIYGTLNDLKSRQNA